MDDILQDIGQLRSISAVTVLLLLLVWESSAPFGFYFVGNSGERLHHGLEKSPCWVSSTRCSPVSFLSRCGGRLRSGLRLTISDC